MDYLIQSSIFIYRYNNFEVYYAIDQTRLFKLIKCTPFYKDLIEYDSEALSNSLMESVTEFLDGFKKVFYKAYRNFSTNPLFSESFSKFQVAMKR